MSKDMRWELKESDPDAVARLSAELGVTDLVARLLVNRKVVETSEARAFLNPRLGDLPDPYSMKGMEAVVTRVVAAIDAEEDICIWGDYDVDGVTSSSQLIWFFRALGKSVRYHVPDRFSEGYGLNSEALTRLAAEGVTLFVTVDCGISNWREIEAVQAAGAEVIVVDHHAIPERIPACLILNPQQSDCEFPDDRLAACGVTWVLLVALRKRLRELDWFAAHGVVEPDLRQWMDLTAIGTVADMVPLKGVNRIIATHGLGRIAESTKSGIQALCEVAGLGERRITAGLVGFHLGPRINAAGRMAHASSGVELMTSEVPDEALEVARGVDRYNLERRQVQQGIFDAAEALAEAHPAPETRRSIVLAQPGWHTGVLGIVASKLVDRYYRPTIVLAIEDGKAKGSARSISGFNMVEELRGLDHLLDKYGGHYFAAGMTLDADKLPEFIAAFEARADAALDAAALVRRLRVDAEVPIDWVGFALIEDLARLEPYGQGNPEPTLMASRVRVHDAYLVGQDKKHVKLRVTTSDGRYIDGIAFGQADALPQPGDDIDIAYVPDLNHYRGRTTVQVRVKAMRPAHS